MRHRFVLPVLISLLAAALWAQQPTHAPDLAVHEWGTFTSMQGSNGISLEGLHHEEEALPGFVHSAQTLIEANPEDRAVKFNALRVTQKMETPVIYFHTDTPRRVRVDVSFTQGLLTQYYPAPQTVWPQQRQLLELFKADRIDMSRVSVSGIGWEVDLIPKSRRAPEEIPRVSGDDPWAFARQVHSAYVRTAASDRAAEAEHYLFYRGLGTFTLPVGVTAAAGGRAVLHNRGDPLPFVAALEMNEDGGRFRVLGSVGAGRDAALGLGGLPLDPDRDWVSRELGAEVLHALVDQGLFLDEARAMVATWSRQWFLSRGTRVIYIVPRPAVDEILPLRIDPVPGKLVRVLVGRLEYMTPEAEARVQQALRARMSEDAGERERAETWLHGLDRFLEAHLRRAIDLATDDAVRRSAEQLLELMTP